jgi:hypothetical protein
MGALVERRYPARRTGAGTLGFNLIYYAPASLVQALLRPPTGAATVLPLWDVLTGAYNPRAQDDYPQTGLDDGEAPDGVLAALVWPLRSFARRRAVS